MNWIFSCLLFVFGSIAFFIPVFFIVRKFVHFSVLKKHHDLAGYVITSLGVLFSVLLGFTIVSTQNNFSKIKERIDNEAYLAADLIRIARSFPEQVRKKIETGIKAYLKSVIEDEWKLMPYKKESLKTLEKLEEFWKPIYEYNPQSEKERIWFNQALDVLTQFNSARLERIYTSWESLGTLSWLALISGSITLVTFLFFFGTENTLAHLLMNSLFIGYFSLMIYVIYALDNPYRPPQILTPKAYEIVYNYYSEEPGSMVSPEEFEYFKNNRN
ncbi:MAG: DUF4239 domain-containing protein [Chlamydiae bacterium]|nr:DUF4239 domain-containing protein [Chlamydiota bacterium]